MAQRPAHRRPNPTAHPTAHGAPRRTPRRDRERPRHRAPRPPLRFRLLPLLGWALVVVAGIALWPQRFGGDTTLVVVHGRSMEPVYHSGDLLFVRATDSVEVGDIAVYRVPSGVGAGENVVHRVVDVADDGSLTFRGDAKAAPDDFRPTTADLVGRPLVNLGPLPLRLLAVTPLLAGSVAALAVGWLLWPAPAVPPAHPVRRGRMPGARGLGRRLRPAEKSAI